MALFSGRLGESFLYHPSGPIVIGLYAVVTLYLSILLFAGLKGPEWEKERKWFQITEVIGVGSLLVGWMAKLLVI
jgi:hypothetical protein